MNRAVGQRLFPRGRASTAGMTLIEMFVAIGVLTFGLTGLVAALMGSVVHRQFSESQTVATNHARQVVERLVAADEGNMLLLWNDIQAGANGEALPTFTLPNEAYTVRFYDPANVVVGNELTTAQMQAAWRPILAEVTVAWSQGQRPVNVRLSTVVNPDRG